MRTPHVLAMVFYLALGALLAGVAALFAPLVARDGWWLIAVGVFGLPALALLVYALGSLLAALDALWRAYVATRAAADRADAEAEAQYWVAVARAHQLGISVPGYLRHAGWTADAIATLEIRTGRDVDGDGRVGAVPINDYRSPETQARNRVMAFVEKSWRLTVEAGGDPRSEATGLARSHWCPGSGAQDRARLEYDAVLEVLTRRPLALVIDRAPGKSGRYAAATVDEALETVRAMWPYVSIPPVLLEGVGATHPTPGPQVGRMES